MTRLRILQKSLTIVKESEISLAAASLAYTTLLSLVPFLAIVLAMFQVFGGLKDFTAQIESLILANLTSGAQGSILPFVKNFIENIHAKTVGFSGLVGLLVTNFLLIQQIDRVFHKIWRLNFDRKFSQKVMYYWASMTLVPGMILSLFVLIRKLPFAGPLSWFFAFGLISSLYRIFSKHPTWIPSLIGGLSCTFGLLLGQIGFQFYVNHFVSFEKIYGTLGSVPLFLLWLYLNWWILIFGATMTYVIEHIHTENFKLKNVFSISLVALFILLNTSLNAFANESETKQYFKSVGKKGEILGLFGEANSTDQKTITKKTEVVICDGDKLIHENLSSTADPFQNKFSPIRFHFERSYNDAKIQEIDAQRPDPSKASLKISYEERGRSPVTFERALKPDEVLDSFFYKAVAAHFSNSPKSKDYTAQIIYEDQAHSRFPSLTTKVTSLGNEKYAISNPMGEFTAKIQPNGTLESLSSKGGELTTTSITSGEFEKLQKKLTCLKTSK